MKQTEKQPNKKGRYAWLILIFLYLLFANGLKTTVPSTNALHLFELVYLGMIVAIVISQVMLKKALLIGDYLILGAFGLLILSGFVSNAFIAYQGTKAALSDGVILSKFIVAYFFGRVCYEEDEINVIMILLKKIVRLVTLFLLACLLLNLMFHLWPSYDSRFGYPIHSLMFSHATYLTSTAVFCLLFLSIKPVKFDVVYIGINSLLVILAARNKGLIFLGVYLFIVLRQAQKKGTSVLGLAGIGSIMYVLFQSTISTRLFSSETAARSTLYQYGFELATSFFPFGAGLGTYGSSASIKNYSSLYGELGFNQLYGFSEETTYYLADSFIAMLLGQFGFLGLGLMAVLLISMFVLLRKNKAYQNFSLLLYIFIMISMITENFISSSHGVLAFLLVGLLVNQRENKENSECSETNGTKPLNI